MSEVGGVSTRRRKARRTARFQRPNDTHLAALARELELPVGEPRVASRLLRHLIVEPLPCYDAAGHPPGWGSADASDYHHNGPRQGACPVRELPTLQAKARQWWWPSRPRVSTGVAPGRV